ncbi:MAG: class I SAM-dependent DNA methyltransferase [Candidatus Gastranaerophilaceae bacterium]
MPSRLEIIEKIGKEYVVENIENGEFSYPKALKLQGKSIDENLVKSKDGTVHKNLDIRFIKDNISILVETKDNFDKWDKDKVLFQMQSYVNYEKVLTGNKIIAILANTEDERFKVWWGSDLIIGDAHQLKNQYALKSFDEYADLYLGKTNNKEMVIKSTYELNDLLFTHGIGEKIRSQFVGTCLLALKNGLKYEHQLKKSIMGGIEEVITNLLEKDLNKAQKLVILKTKVLESQDVRALDAESLQEILRKIETDILPYINDKNTQGQDILNLFFTTFNKFVGKEDKNQAFTPDHIVHFMCQVVGINRYSRVLDPCCGSGAFLVRAMTEAMDDCANKDEMDRVKKEQIYGIEWEEKAFGLSTTNMLIHSDGNSNVRQGSCFDLDDFIENANINTVLMNPPYNAQRKCSQKEYTATWSKTTKEDPSKGFHYVYYIASKVKNGKLAVLLPMACAIGSKNEKEIRKFKQKMLEEHTLDAVFSLPSDMFHPGASANACCMVFNLGTRHENAPIKETFFGYFKDDGFIKKKNMGRVEKTKPNSTEGIWNDIESKWLYLYRRRQTETGLSICKKVTATDEWLCEAYMDTDYSTLSDSDFEKTIKEFYACQVLVGINE